MPSTNFKDYMIKLRENCSNCHLGKVKNPIAKAYGEQSLSWDKFQEFVGHDLGDLVDYSRTECPICLGRGYFETWINMDEFVASISVDVADTIDKRELLSRVFGDKEDQS